MNKLDQPITHGGFHFADFVSRDEDTVSARDGVYMYGKGWAAGRVNLIRADRTFRVVANLPE